MQAPLRLLTSLRGTVEIGLSLAIAVATATFVATPLILPAVAERYDVGTGTAGLFSAAQLGAFVIGSWGSGRVTEPSRALFVRAVLVLAAAAVVSVVAPSFAVLVAARAVAGLALGVLTWLAYSQVFGDDDRTGDIAVVGPIAGVVASPLIGLVLTRGDDRHVFAALAVVTLVPLLRVPHFVVADVEARARTRAVPQAFVLIVALALLTFGGVGVFVFLGVVGVEQYGMDPFVISVVFSANAAASIPAARWRGRRPLVGLWLLLPAGFALALMMLDQPVVFWVLIIAWGFCFWVAVPGIYTLLAERSRHPAERAGDAQAAMAAGRALGPLLGGVVVGAGGFGALGVAGAAVMAAAALAVLGVELRSEAAGVPADGEAGGSDEQWQGPAGDTGVEG